MSLLAGSIETHKNSNFSKKYMNVSIIESNAHTKDS